MKHWDWPSAGYWFFGQAVAVGLLMLGGSYGGTLAGAACAAVLLAWLNRKPVNL